MKNLTFFWNEELGQADCIFTTHGQMFNGQAFCHPEDAMFKSEKVGCTIAEYRAQIMALRYWRDCELKPGLKALNQLYYSINTSKYYQADNYAETMLTRQIELKKIDIATANEKLKELKQELKNYLTNIAKAHASIRRQRLDKNI